MEYRYIDVQKMLNENDIFLEYCNKYFIDLDFNYNFKCYNTLLNTYVVVRCDKNLKPFETILLK